MDADLKFYAQLVIHIVLNSNNTVLIFASVPVKESGAEQGDPHDRLTECIITSGKDTSRSNLERQRSATLDIRGKQLLESTHQMPSCAATGGIAPPLRIACTTKLKR